MYKREFDAILTSKNIPRCVMIYGACDYQISLLEREILSAWGNEGVLKFYFDEYDFSQARAHLSQASLFGDKNTLILKLEKAPQLKELEEFSSLCEKNDINRFLFIFYGEDAKAKTLTKPFGKMFVRVFKPNLTEAISYMENEARKLKLSIDKTALGELYSENNENLLMSVNDLAKLSLLNRQISLQDVSNLASNAGELGLEEFITKFFANVNVKKIYKTLSQEGSVDEIRLISALLGHLYKLFLFSAYIKMHGAYDPLKILGHPLPPQIAKNYADMSIRLKPHTFAKLFRLLTDAEFTLKTLSQIDKESYLIATLIAVQSALV